MSLSWLTECISFCPYSSWALPRKKMTCGRNPVINRKAVFWGLKKTPGWRQDGNMPGMGPFTGELQSCLLWCHCEAHCSARHPFELMKWCLCISIFYQHSMSQGTLMSKSISLVVTDSRFLLSRFGTTKNILMTSWPHFYQGIHVWFEGYVLRPEIIRT